LAPDQTAPRYLAVGSRFHPNGRGERAGQERQSGAAAGLAKPDDPNRQPGSCSAARRHRRSETRTIGFYWGLRSSIALPINGRTWQVMRLSRNRNWGHPNLINSRKSRRPAPKTGWRGLLVGDISQPTAARCAPATSHQSASARYSLRRPPRSAEGGRNVRDHGGCGRYKGRPPEHMDAGAPERDQAAGTRRSPASSSMRRSKALCRDAGNDCR
jgi:penicillin-insensitive murein endopeptidase